MRVRMGAKRGANLGEVDVVLKVVKKFVKLVVNVEGLVVGVKAMATVVLVIVAKWLFVP